MDKQGYVYILASKPNGTLYIGVTSNAVARVWQHREKLVKGFTEKYTVDRLVWFESCDSIVGAIAREKQLKKWNRDWKIRLIVDANPDWNDLYPTLI